MTPTAADVEAARGRIAGLVRPTPLLESPALAGSAGAPVLLKLENLQVTGSFKARGAANKILSLPEEVRRRGVVTCSSGNHGLAVAHVAGVVGIPAIVCVPRWVDPVKLQRIRSRGAELEAGSASYDQAEDRAREIAARRGATYVDPFDDPAVVGGQGTIGLEIAEARPELAGADPAGAEPVTVLVPLSGGGLISGIALALRARWPGVRVMAVYAQRARVMAASIEAGRPLELPEEETLATALAGGIGRPNQWTFPLVQELVDDFIPVSEEEIARAMAFAFEEHRLVVEGGGAVTLAALLAGRVSAPGPTVAVLSGGNVSLSHLAEVLAAAG